MIVVHCPLKQKEIIEAVENVKMDDQKVFRFIKKDGIRLYFHSQMENEDEAIAVIEGVIHRLPFGRILFYHVGGVEFPWQSLENIENN